MHADAGPCLQAYQNATPVLVDDLPSEAWRWPEFAQRADEYDYRAVAALPLRLRAERVGALSLFREDSGPMSSVDVAVGQALADMAAIGILHQRVSSHSDQLNQQLQTALSTRLIIEQAKGVIAERGSITMDQAFALLRERARSTNRRLADLACTVVDGAGAEEVFGGEAIGSSVARTTAEIGSALTSVQGAGLSESRLLVTTGFVRQRVLFARRRSDFV